MQTNSNLAQSEREREISQWPSKRRPLGSSPSSLNLILWWDLLGAKKDYLICTSNALKYLKQTTNKNKKCDTGEPNQNNLFLVTFHTVLGLCLKHLVDPLLYFLLPPQPKLTENNPNIWRGGGGGGAILVGICKPVNINHMLLKWFHITHE